jgi:hypothetical protein
MGVEGLPQRLGQLDCVVVGPEVQRPWSSAGWPAETRLRSWFPIADSVSGMCPAFSTALIGFGLDS